MWLNASVLHRWVKEAGRWAALVRYLDDGGLPIDKIESVQSLSEGATANSICMPTGRTAAASLAVGIEYNLAIRELYSHGPYFCSAVLSY
jgi:hypothetical protein